MRSLRKIKSNILSEVIEGAAERQPFLFVCILECHSERSVAQLRIYESKDSFKIRYPADCSDDADFI